MKRKNPKYIICISWTEQYRSNSEKYQENIQSFLLNANNSSQPIDSITNGMNVQKNSRYGEPIQILMSDMKYALSNTVAVVCRIIARNESSNRMNKQF